MNILPKKSWHVRNIDNIERVRRDEAKAAEEEKKQQARAAIAEREARTKLLRDRAQSRGAVGFVGTEVLPVDASNQVKNVNFFSDLEIQTKTGNKDHEAEKKAEQEAWEKKVGILTHLGQSVLDSKQTLVHGQRPEIPELDPDLKRKEMMDPLNQMRRYLGQSGADTGKRLKGHDGKTKEQSTSNAKDTKPSRLAYQSHISKSSRHSSHKKSSKRKKKHKHRHRKEREDSPRTDRTVRQHTDIEQLRAERLKRENEERKRTERFLSGGGLLEKQAEDIGLTDARDGRYNSQFHPHLARQRLAKDSSRN